MPGNGRIARGIALHCPEKKSKKKKEVNEGSPTQASAAEQKAETLVDHREKKKKKKRNEIFNTGQKMEEEIPGGRFRELSSRGGKLAGHRAGYCTDGTTDGGKKGGNWELGHGKKKKRSSVNKLGAHIPVGKRPGELPGQRRAEKMERPSVGVTVRKKPARGKKEGREKIGKRQFQHRDKNGTNRNYYRGMKPSKRNQWRNQQERKSSKNGLGRNNSLTCPKRISRKDRERCVTKTNNRRQLGG